MNNSKLANYLPNDSLAFEFLKFAQKHQAGNNIRWNHVQLAKEIAQQFGNVSKRIAIAFGCAHAAE